MWATPTQRTCNATGCAEQLADGTIFEWGGLSCLSGIENQVFPLPIAFPHSFAGINATYGSNIDPSIPMALGVQPISNSHFTVTCAMDPAYYGHYWGIQYIAWGT